MSKQSPSSKVAEQASSVRTARQKARQQPAATMLDAGLVPAKPRRKISYLPGDSPREEPAELPRLFIRGLIGGSFRMDLQGLDVGFSNAAFAHWVTDESMAELHIHRGDIAIIDPMRPMRPGDLLLLHLDGRDVLRRLAKKKGVWFLEAGEGAAFTSKPLLDYALHGIVLWVLRLFTDVKAIPYPGTDANFSTPAERPSTKARVYPAYSKTPQPQQKRRGEAKRSLILASEGKAPYRLSELGEASLYKA